MPLCSYTFPNNKAKLYRECYMMSISKNRRGEKTRGAQYYGWTLQLALLGFLTMGVISGCALWRRCFSPSEISSLCASLSADFGQTGAWAVIARAWAVVPVIAVLVASAFFAFGWICVPAVLFSFGLGLGAQLCSLIGTRDILPALPAIASFALPAAIAVSLAVMLGGDCVSASLSLADDRGDRRAACAKLFIRIPFYLLALLLYAWIRKMMLA